MCKTLLLILSLIAAFSLSAGHALHLQDRMKPRSAALIHPQESSGSPHVVSSERLRQIRSELLYNFSDHGGSDGNGDFQRDIISSMPEIQKNLTFTLPFFGLTFNYVRVSLNGYLDFTNLPEHYTYPLVFPNPKWPQEIDPTFIGIFFSKCRLGQLYPEDVDQRRPGVYFRLESDLDTRTDESGVELRERLKADIQEALEESESFIPKYAIIATWKNMSFAGGIDNSRYLTNTFQVVLATDEIRTYALFNYADIEWLSHTEAGGDTTTGMGGVPAFVGFNKGNGSEAYEYFPYSQTSQLRNIASQGCSRPGRHIFRIDGEIALGTCTNTH